MQQFGPQFINDHLLPLLEKMLSDAALSHVPGSGQESVAFLDQMFIRENVTSIDQVINPVDLKTLRNSYFNDAKKTAGVPFAGTGAEDEKEQSELLTCAVKYMANHGGKETERRRAFLPVLDQKNKAANVAVWPAEVKRNVYLMAYDIAETFQKNTIDGIIQQKKQLAEKQEAIDEVKKDEELFQKGQLILVKDPVTNQFTKYIRAEDLQPGQEAVQFVPPPTAAAQQFMQPGFAIPSQQTLDAVAAGGIAPQPYENLVSGGKSVSPQASVAGNNFAPVPANTVPDQKSSNDELAHTFEENRGKAITNQLKKQGFQIEPNAQVQFDNNHHAFIKAKSGPDSVLISADMRVLPKEDLKLTVTFQDGSHAGKSMTIDESKLGEAFKKPDGTKATAGEVYDDRSKKMVQREGQPEHAPAKAPSGKEGETFKLPTGIKEGVAKPLEGPLAGAAATGGIPGGPAAGQAAAPGREKLPANIKAPQMPTARAQMEAGAGGPQYQVARPLAGIPGGTMAAKEKLRQQQAAAGGEGETAENVPRAPGRIREEEPAPAAAGKKKSGHPMAIAAGTTLGATAGIGGGTVSLGGALAAGGPGGAGALTTMKIVKTIFIVLGSHLHRFFG
jgi:hypothetical protein